jgi:hypothetical protein
MDSSKLLKVIKALVKEEVKSVVSSVVKERVEMELNKILAERFLNSLAGGSTNLVEARKPAPSAPRPQKSAAVITEERRKELLKKIGAENNPMFEDVRLPGEDGEFDDDDEGVDLSQFGLRAQ